MTFFELWVVGIGGFLGAIARFSFSRFINKKFTFRIPIATATINLLGSFLLGLLISSGLNNNSILFLGTGFMGAFTTFSTFKLEGVQLYLNKRKKEFFIYNLISYGGGILLALIGSEIGKYLF
ncbi:fluoride efflux transporter CrcB [Peribacillus saganii]|uniref:Fluoride-specific ion channel FluC n=1 Tax=Peribacillus saganii TaxID=2303992 RepID=A0A372LN42_9BACI|nr:fluoride efflux transporter CrcB [Peribacillus saganii]RFU68121.1 fluoride efflux transporter CrcB [Peribacillus saganii]